MLTLPKKGQERGIEKALAGGLRKGLTAVFERSLFVWKVATLPEMTILLGIRIF